MENDIKYVKNNFWPLCKEREYRRGHSVPSAEELQSELDRWSREVAHTRTIQGVGRRPVDIFCEEEQATLKPLRASRWDEVTWAKHKVQETWRIQFDRAFYSVPYQYIGYTVIVYATSTQVEIYLGDKEITRHERARYEWQYVRNSLHAPPDPERYMQETRERLLERALSLGIPVSQVALSLFNRKGVDGMRPVRALLALSGKYGSDRLTAACRRALLYDTPEYATVKRILVRNLDGRKDGDAVDSTGNRCFTFARSSGYFLPENHTEGEVESWNN